MQDEKQQSNIMENLSIMDNREAFEAWRNSDIPIFNGERKWRDVVVSPLDVWQAAIAQERIESQKREAALQAFIKDLRFNYELGDELDAKMDKLLGANK